MRESDSVYTVTFEGKREMMMTRKVYQEIPKNRIKVMVRFSRGASPERKRERYTCKNWCAVCTTKKVLRYEECVVKM